MARKTTASSLLEWHPLTSTHYREVILGRGFKDFGRLFFLAFFWFPIPKTNGNWNISKGFVAFCWHARVASLLSAMPLYFHWIALANAVGRIFNDIGPSSSTNALEQWLNVHIGLSGEPYVIIADAAWAWLAAQLTLRTFMKIYMHLKPAAEKTSGS